MTVQEIQDTVALQTIQRAVADHILQEYLPGAKSDELTGSTPLISGGIVDSLGILNLVTFLEDQFKIQLEAYEVSMANLNTTYDIAKLVYSKLPSETMGTPSEVKR